MATANPISAQSKPQREPEKKPAEPHVDATPDELAGILTRMRQAQRKAGTPSYEKRVELLDKLERAVFHSKERFVEAINADFGNRSRHETLIAEVLMTLNSIKHTRAHLHEWMEVESRPVSWLFAPGRAELIPQPLGVIGIISPWNYPMQLAIVPLAQALAAGNRAMIKPSEQTPQTAEAIARMIKETFADDEVTVVTGDHGIGAAFAALPFDHLVFTGSTRLGRLVMRAAAENLVPVTLELGGKSPTIVHEDFPLDVGATRIMYGKCFNAGQTCIAPDYVLVPRASMDRFVDECKAAVAKMYPTLAKNPDYSSIVNDRHRARLRGYLEEAQSKDARIVELNPAKETFDDHKLPPTLVIDPPKDLALMNEEIFGPILPIVPYGTIDEAIAYVNERPRPLALYFFGYDDEAMHKVLDQTVSGGVSINETMVHFAQDDLPFGGVGESGIGHYHGREGFDALTKRKPVFYQAR
ncbi:MAG TPA: coniferyl aldehyde dehydrogenase, partial [Polyangiaceae bacterium]|nr:coniferyl aldehyde dehydrogenase [Polyangiaceae bacterium]